MPLGPGYLPRYFPGWRHGLNSCIGPLVTTAFIERSEMEMVKCQAECSRLITWDNIQTKELQYMQGTLYTSGIGNVSGMDCTHVPLQITYTEWQVSAVVMGFITGFRHQWVTWVMTGSRSAESNNWFGLRCCNIGTQRRWAGPWLQSTTENRAVKKSESMSGKCPNM